MSRNAKKMVADREQEQAPKPAAGITTCAAAGCPLLGTIRRESSHQAVCPCHARAPTDGWPKATAVILKHESLWRFAREAQMAPALDAVNPEIAANLLRAAKGAGVQLNNAQREQYRMLLARIRAGGPGMPLRMAGALIEDAICSEAVAAASESEMTVGTVGAEAKKKKSKLEEAIWSLATHFAEAA